jgi:hypothetical protein
MKTLLNLSALIAFLAVARPSMGMISIDEVTTAKAKQLGIELTAKANGPKEAWIKLEFKPEGRSRTSSTNPRRRSLFAGLGPIEG